MSELSHYTVVPHLIALCVLLGWAAWRDIATRTIPDGVSIALALIGAVIRLAEGWPALGWSVLVSVCLFFALLPFCSRGLLGGADLKLIAALAMGFSPHLSLTLLFTVTLVGGGLALLYLIMGRIISWLGLTLPVGARPRSLLTRIASVECWRIQRHASLPYGVAIAIGAVLVVVQNQGS